MTYQNNPQTTGFRELSPQELEAISGGVIESYGPGFTVYGQRQNLGFYGGAGSPGLGHDSGVVEDDRNGETGDNSIFDCELLGIATTVVLGTIAAPGATLVTGNPITGVIFAGLLGAVAGETVEVICEGHPNYGRNPN